MARWSIGIDLGGTKTQMALVSQEGVIERELRLKTPIEFEKAVAAIAEAAVSLIEGIPSEHVGGVGIGMAGQIEKETGLVLLAPNLGWRYVPLRAALAELLKLPVFINNDVRVATIGEWQYGAGQGSSDILCLLIGTGIGGGIVSGGQLLTGHSNTAGELGHIAIALGGPRCSCGNIGCLEAIAGGWAIAMRMKELLAAEPQERLWFCDHGIAIDEIDASHVFLAAKAGLPSAKAVIARAEEALIAGVAGLINAFNPEKVILGGGIIDGQPEWLTALSYEVPRRALPAACHNLQVIKGALGSDAGVIGAAAYAFQKQQEGLFYESSASKHSKQQSV